MSWSSLPTELKSQILHSYIDTTLSSILTSVHNPDLCCPADAEMKLVLNGIVERDLGPEEWGMMAQWDTLIDAEIEKKTARYNDTKIPITPIKELTKLTLVFPHFEDEIRARCLREEKSRAKEAWCRSFWYGLRMKGQYGIVPDGQIIISFECLSREVDEWYEFRRKNYWGCINCPDCIRRQMEDLRGSMEVWEALRGARRWWCLSGKEEVDEVDVERKREVVEGQDQYGHVLSSVVVKDQS